ncbi:MAG TPA: DUF4252 domain-containing protein [Terriglobia bacterium]|nr:DUF4252 domain-containing protein [Terriglobia bacterium]
MRKVILVSLLLIATRLNAQQLNLQSLDKFADKAKDKVVMDLDQASLQLASSFLSSEKKDEAAARKISSDLKGIYVRVFEFDRAGVYTEADLKPVRDQLKAPQWKRILTVQDDEEVGIWTYSEAGMPAGIAIVVAGANELTVVNLVGPIRPQDLSNIGGQFGIPEIKNLKKD